MRRLYNGLDQAPWLARLLRWARTTIPSRRGLVTLGAIGLTLISFVVHVLYLASGQNVWLGLCGFGLLHLAVLIGFFGILLAEALGRGFRD